jgi:hypothetical protein
MILRVKVGVGDRAWVRVGMKVGVGDRVWIRVGIGVKDTYR